MAVQDVKITGNRKIVIAGDFNHFDGESYDSIVRLHPDGSIDDTFGSNLNIDDSIRSIAIQEDGKILIGGFFNVVGNNKKGRIARLNNDGTLDLEFLSGSGANGSVYEIAIQPDGRILIGGSFRINGLSRNGLVRLMTDGDIDPTVNYGKGANGSVLAIEVRSDRNNNWRRIYIV